MFLFESCCRRKKRDRYDELQVDNELEEVRDINPHQELTNAKIQNAANFLSQIQQNVPESIAFLQRIVYKGDLQKKIKRFNELFLPNRENPIEDTRLFFVRLNGIIV